MKLLAPGVDVGNILPMKSATNRERNRNRDVRAHVSALLVFSTPNFVLVEVLDVRERRTRGAPNEQYRSLLIEKRLCLLPHARDAEVPCLP